MIQRAAIYCRLSTEDENKMPQEDSESIRNQHRLLEEYARTNGYCIYCSYVDENYSGLDNRRPAFLQMLQDARHGRFQVILCKNQSRFTRDSETADQYLNHLFPLWGIRLIGVSDGTDTLDNRGRKLRQINGLLNEWYSEDLSDNIRLVLHDKMRAGQFVGSFPCYGYTKDPQNHHRLIPDPPAAAIVRDIYDACLQGNSLRAIALQLNRRGIPSPSHYKVQQGLLFQSPFCPHPKESRWSASSVRRILTNPVYTGTLIQGTCCKESFKSSHRVPTAPEHWHICPDSHPPLISQDAFLQAGASLTARNKRKHTS